MNPLTTAQQVAPVLPCASWSSLSPAENRILALFPKATADDWQDWRWQIRNRIRTLAMISQVLQLAPEEIEGIQQAGNKLTMSIPPYFASLMDSHDESCPIRRQCVPRGDEFKVSQGELVDPCGEDQHMPVHGLVHRYPDRVLFLVNEMCAMYCRYCTRSRMVGDGQRTLSRKTYEDALAYIQTHEEVRDVLISGGDPLTMADTVLDDLLTRLKQIPHVEFVRIGTRVPVTLPQRITPAFISLLKKHAPVWMSIHFNHPREITPAVKAACNSLADAGVPMGSQTVLLKGVNDSAEVLKKLSHELLKIRVRPYYLYQCDPVVGSSHFRTSVDEGIAIMRKLRGFTTGYAVPTYVIDAPGGGGKIPIGPDYVVSRQKNEIILRNFQGKLFSYPDLSE